MKKLFLMFFVATVLFACNNESNSDTINTDTAAAPQDNTINRDTSTLMTDTSMRRDSM